jgi:hypothetical protein
MYREVCDFIHCSMSLFYAAAATTIITMLDPIAI